MPDNDTIPLQSKVKRITIPALQNMKKQGEMISALSIYDAQYARLFDEAGGDVIIVGDSAAMTVLGRPNTLSTTMEEMIVFGKAVRRGTNRVFVVVDMPLASYEVSNEEAIRNALRLIKETGGNAVKTEINDVYVDRVRAISNACLVVAHIGLNPNKAEMLGGYKTLGKTEKSYRELAKIVKAAEEAGSCMILVEAVTEEVAAKLREEVKVPVIGIAAGRKMDGQLVISYDLLGLYQWPGNTPKHFERYLTERQGITIAEATLDAFKWYVKAVKEKRFPSDKHVHHLKPEELQYVLDQNNGQEPFYPAPDMS